MAVYVTPQVLVYQEIQSVPAVDIRPLPAHISGGHANLIRYSDPDEKDNGRLGAYDPVANDDDTGGKVYDFAESLARPAGAVVDPGYTRVFIDDALLRYYDHTTADLDDTISTVADKLNRLAAVNTIFQTGVLSDHSAIFKDRGVMLGDYARVRAVVDGETYELCTFIAGFVADVVPAVLGAPSEDSDNVADNVTASSSAVKIPGDYHNCVDVTALDHSTYDGSEDGDIEEIYTVEVMESSLDGVATTAQLRVSSQSGNDPTVLITPEDFGSPTAIGSRGLKVTWDNTESAACSISATDDGISPIDFVKGQKWEITVHQAWTKPTLAKDGDYSGAQDVTYIIEVTKGGDLSSDNAEVMVSTDRGTDSSGPTKVSSGNLFNVGTRGVQMSFTGAALAGGDRYYIEVAAETEGDHHGLILGHNFAQEVIDNGPTDVSLTLYIKKNIEVPENQMLVTDDGTEYRTNWEQDETQLILMADVMAYDASWTDDGVALALPVDTVCDKSVVFAEVRYWLAELCNEVNFLNDVANIEDAISGPLHPDNPLKWGVYKALQNSNGIAVGYTSVCNPDDVDSWVRVLDLIDGRPDTYGLVPLTRNETVWGLYQAHVGAQSSAEFGRWRVVWLNADEIPEKMIVNATNSTDEEEVLAVLEDDPDAEGTQYTRLRSTTGNGQFVTNDVQAGDIVRYLYSTDAFGEVAYTELIVDEVEGEDLIRLLHSYDGGPISTPRKIEIWRTLTATKESEELAKTRGFKDRRVRMVWPNEVGQDGYIVPGYFLCCCLAGLTSGVVPQQGLTRLEIAGCDDVSQTISKFNRSQLNTMAAGGVWIVTQDTTSGMIMSRHAMTTAPYDRIAEREEMVVRNLDSISYYFLEIYDPYIGISNVTESTVVMLRAETNGALKFLTTSYYVQRLGGQIIEGEIAALRQHARLKDRIVVALNLTLPYPLNNIECHLVLVA